MDWEFKKEEGVLEVALAGDLTIFQAADLQKDFLQHLQTPVDCRLDLSGVGEIDSSGMQLILSLERYLETDGMSLVLARTSASFDEAASQIGLDLHFDAEL